MQTNIMVEMNARKKKLEGITTIAVIVFVVFVVILYLLFLKKLTLFQDSFLTDIVGHIKTNITSLSMLGTFYIALFGGLFFIFVPMEALYIKSLSDNNPLLLFLLFMVGIMISYSLDYLIGMKLSKLSKKLISPKKFYGIKSAINKYGKIGIFLASAIPMLPSQQVTFILGVFRYNKTRLFMLTIGGQFLKFGVLALVFGSLL